ncbi:MAG: 50S ribosomal protein L30 [Bdellovibrionota bacterium]|nr:MAG: 50S ribosomal protein L30 [Bdellovibrionota bacterium]
MAKNPSASKSSSAHKVLLTQVGSYIGRDERVRSTLKALGLGRRGKTSNIPLNEATKGMIAKVSHLISVSAS